MQRMQIQLQCIRTDKGGEYARTSEFNKMLLQEFQLTLPSTGRNASWLNGKIERPNRTIATMIRTLLLFDSGLPNKFMVSCSRT